MKFIDEVLISIQAGKGGDGCASFRREKFIPRGGPDGGNGGEGGSVFIIADRNLNTLIDYKNKHFYKAQDGHSGRGKKLSGKKGQHLYLKVPIGTIIYNELSNIKLGEVTSHGELFSIAKGGKKGLGNTNFKSSTNRAPLFFSQGSPGEKYSSVRLELKILADVGLLGLPNAGKSTLVQNVSNSKPKIAPYPFTTLYPNLGTVQINPSDQFVIADIPGLIQGASKNMGLGSRFLKHLSRTRIILHVIDIAPEDGSDPVENYFNIEQELKNYSLYLYKKPRILILNKVDKLYSDSQVDRFCGYFIKKIDWPLTSMYFTISSLTKYNLDLMIKKISSYLKKII